MRENKLIIFCLLIINLSTIPNVCEGHRTAEELRYANWVLTG